MRSINMKKIGLFLFAILLLLINSFSFAGDYKAGKSVKISENDTINSDLFIAAQHGSIYGLVKGDIWMACRSINIKNITSNSILAAAENIDIESKIGSSALLLGGRIKFKGQISGGMKAAGGTIFINGNIGRDLIVVGGEVYIEKGTIINGDLIILGGGEVVIDGTVKGNLIGNAEKISIYGLVEKNVDLKIEKELNLESGCKINGDFCYKSEHEFSIDKNLIMGKVSFEKKHYDEWKFIEFKNIFLIYSLIAALVFAFIILPFTRSKLQPLFEKLDSSIWSTLGFGFLGVIVTPIILVILLALVVTIPVSIVLGLLYLIMLYVGKIFAGIYLGHTLMFLINKKESNIFLSALLGLGILYAMFFIPYLGGIIYFLTICYGFGISMKFVGGMFSKNQA
jgi:hypothetical protein